MSFRPMLRPGQGFQQFKVYRRTSEKTAGGRVSTGELVRQGEFFGIISQASPHEVAQSKQLGTPITHTIVQRGTKNRARANDVLELQSGDKSRKFHVKGDPHDPGELGHFLVYRVEERDDIK